MTFEAALNVFIFYFFFFTAEREMETEGRRKERVRGDETEGRRERARDTGRERDLHSRHAVRRVIKSPKRSINSNR